MFKHLISAAIVSLAAIAAFFTAHQTTSPSDVSDLQARNIETLSRSEIGENCGGCDSSYKGTHCCWLFIVTNYDPTTDTAEGLLVELYHPATIFG